MKKSPIRRGLTLVMAVFASFLFAQTALASTVTYKGQETLFEFDGGEGAATKADLFGNLKDLYPGDTVEQPISIKNSHPKGSAIEVFLRAVPHDDSSNPLSDAVKANEEAADKSKSAVENNQDFLSQLTLKVVNKATGKTIFEGKADKTGGLADPVSLGTLAKDEVVELTATLSVPSALDSKYTGRLGEVDWEFSVKEPVPALSVEKTVTSKPSNGEYYAEGEKASFQIKVTNSGEFDLSGVAVSDPLTGLTETVDKLAAGESKTFETDYTVTAKDVTAGEVTNTASATADDPTDSSKKVTAESSVKVKTNAESSSSSTPDSSGSSTPGTSSTSTTPSTSGTSGTTTTTTSQTTPRTGDATASGVVGVCVLAAIALISLAALRKRAN